MDAVAALTADEATYVLGFRDADALRGGIAKARGARDERLRAKGVRLDEAKGVEPLSKPSSGTSRLSNVREARQRNASQRLWNRL